MNILMVTERYIPIWGGAENQLKQLIPRLTQLGCTIKVVTRRWHRTMLPIERVDDTEVFRLGIPGTGIFAASMFVFALLLFIIRHRTWIDILHSHGAVNMGALCRVSAWFLGKTNVAKIASAGRIPPLSDKISGRILLFFFKQSDAIISMTGEIDRELEVIGTNLRKIKRIVNGVDGDKFFLFDEREQKKVRCELGLPVDSPVVLFSSRLVAGKGLRVLLDAWPLIQAKNPRAWLVVLGSGVLQNNSIEEEVKQRVEVDKLPNVKFMGETTKPEVFLGCADAFIFPSRREGFPNALMEALVTGLPVIASDIGGVTEIIINDRLGVLFQSGNTEDLVTKVVDVLGNLDYAKKQAMFTRRYMMENFSFGLIASRYFSLYKELLVDAPHSYHPRRLL
jgi:glycosyltransferase involved in cell wall biosynthesis